MGSGASLNVKKRRTAEFTKLDAADEMEQSAAECAKRRASECVKQRCEWQHRALRR